MIAAAVTVTQKVVLMVWEGRVAHCGRRRKAGRARGGLQPEPFERSPTYLAVESPWVVVPGMGITGWEGRCTASSSRYGRSRRRRSSRPWRSSRWGSASVRTRRSSRSSTRCSFRRFPWRSWSTCPLPVRSPARSRATRRATARMSSATRCSETSSGSSAALVGLRHTSSSGRIWRFRDKPRTARACSSRGPTSPSWVSNLPSADSWARPTIRPSASTMSRS